MDNFINKLFSEGTLIISACVIAGSSTIMCMGGKVDIENIYKYDDFIEIFIGDNSVTIPFSYNNLLYEQNGTNDEYDFEYNGFKISVSFIN